MYWWKHSGKSEIAFIDGFDTMLMNVKGVAQRKDDNIGSRHIDERYLLAKGPYFLFCLKECVKIIFNNKGIFSRRGNMHQFLKLQMILNEFRIKSFDMA